MITTYLNFIEECQLPDGKFIDYIDHSHKVATDQNDEKAIKDGADTPGYPREHSNDDDIESELDQIERKEKYKEDSSDE